MGCPGVQLLELLTNNEHNLQALIVAVSRQHINDPQQRLFMQQLTQYQLPLITLIDSVSHEHLDQLKQQGASLSLSQPFLHQRLYQALRRALGKDTSEASDHNPAAPGTLPARAPCPAAAPETCCLIEK